MDIKILVASHKKAEMPEDSMYLPVHVGRALYPDREFGYQSDAEGDNISIKNPYYCELTALYWAWKNLKADYVGLAHYRRHFSLKTVHRGGWNSVLTGKQAEILCRKHDISARLRARSAKRCRAAPISPRCVARAAVRTTSKRHGNWMIF